MFTSAHAAEEKETKEDVEVIEVKGVRASIASANQLKRESNKVVDAIVAEDIGKLPDSNVAEALQRVTGVQIERERGEGSRISIRGLSADLNRTEVNGMSFAGTSTSREADFRNIPSQFISKIEVVKSPTASMTEGAVGGWVQIHTLRPFDGEGGFKAVATAKVRSIPGADTEATDENSPEYNFLLSNTFNDKFGASIMYQAGEHNGRSDIMEDLFWANLDVDGDAAPEHMPQVPRYFMNLVSEERESYTASLQYRPTEDIEFIFDATHSERKTDINNYVVNYLHLPGWGVNSNFVKEGDTVVGFDNELALFQSLSSEYEENRETDTFSLSADWQLNDSLEVRGLLGSSKGGYDQPLLNVVFNKFNIPLHTMGRTDEDGVWTTTDDLENYGSSGTDYLQFQSIFSQQKIEQDESLAQLDVKYTFDTGFISSIEGGIQARSTEFSSTGALLVRNLGLGLDPIDPNFPTNPDVMKDLPGEFGGVYDNDTSAIPNNFWVPNTDLFLDTFYSDQERKDVANYAPQYQDAGKVWKIKETITGAYLQINFESEFSDMPFSGNFGIRHVKTETDTDGYANVASSGFDDPISLSGEYSDTLPSFNASLEVTDDFIVRVAASEVIARPKVTDLVPSLTYNSVTLTAFGGNPDLDPFRAKQADVVFEYYQEHSSVAVGMFYKDVESFVTPGFLAVDLFDNGDIYQYQTPTNGEGATIKGVELAANHQFATLPEPWNGLGVSANYTYVDAPTRDVNEITGEELPFPGMSDDSYNLTAYWENYGWSANIAFNYRGEYLVANRTFGAGGTVGPQIAEDYSDLSANVSYAYSDHLAFFVAASNLTDSYMRIKSEPGSDRNVGTISWGRQYEAGISYKF